MELSRFSLGLRFALTKGTEPAPEEIWAVLFSRVCPRGLDGLHLFGGLDQNAVNEPEPAYVCVFSGLSLKRAKALYQRLLSDGYLCSFLTAYMPFVQHNMIEKYTDLAYFGVIDGNGWVIAEDEKSKRGQFIGLEKSLKDIEKPAGRILIAPETLEERLPSGLVGRALMRAFAGAYPNTVLEMRQIAEGGPGTLEALVSGSCGRYQSIEIQNQEGLSLRAPFGVLPDRTVVLETGRIPVHLLMTVMESIAQSGYRSFLLAAGEEDLPEKYPPTYTVTILDNHPRTDLPSEDNVSYRSGVEMVLETGGTLQIMKKATLVITAIRMTDGHCALRGVAGDSVLYHCRTNGIPVGVLFYRPEGGSYFVQLPGRPPEEITAGSIFEAATCLAGKIQKEAVPNILSLRRA